MITDDIREILFQLQDVQYKAFQAKLIPTVGAQTIIGVRTPELRKLAGQLGRWQDLPDFLSALPHPYFEENQLHAFLLSGMKDFDRCIEALNLFLPYIDNWATCDQMSPKVFQKHKAELLPWISQWIHGKEAYTVRFGVGMLMQHYLDEAFDPALPELVAGIHSDEYYVQMMIAWYFATALAKQYRAVLPYLEQRRLDPWTHNKTIRKAIESYRIPPERKAELRGLKADLKK